MIKAVVTRGEETLIQSTYYEPTLTLETVITRLEHYVSSEQLNVEGECTIKASFSTINTGDKS